MQPRTSVGLFGNSLLKTCENLHSLGGKMRKTCAINKMRVPDFKRFPARSSFPWFNLL